MTEKGWKKVESKGTGQEWNFDNPLNNLEKGAFMEGKFLGIQTIDTTYGEREIALIKTEDGVVNAVFLPTALKTYLSQVPEGALVRIKCLGKVKGKRGRYWDFEVLYKEV